MDLKLSNPSSFGHAEDNLIEGGQGAETAFVAQPIPAKYQQIPPSSLEVSVEDLAHLYAAHLGDRRNGTHTAPDFRDGVHMHKLIDLMYASSESGALQEVDLNTADSSQSYGVAETARAH